MPQLVEIFLPKEQAYNCIHIKRLDMITFS